MQEYRKHIAKLEGKLLSQRGTATDDTSFFPLNDSGFLGDTTGAATTNININSEAWGRGDANRNYEAYLRFEEERRRNDDLRIQLDNERLNNEQLQSEIERIRREYDRDFREKERRYQNRERNLAQYLSDEQKKMLDLWHELQRVRKQFADLKVQTEEDLEKQRADFNRIFRSLQGLTKSSSGDFLIGGGAGGTNTYNLDTFIQETIRRYGGRSAGAPYATDLELLALLKNKSTTEDTGLHDELMKKYEEAIERNIELESKGDENARKVSELDAELRRSKDKLIECQVIKQFFKL